MAGESHVNVLTCLHFVHHEALLGEAQAQLEAMQDELHRLVCAPVGTYKTVTTILWPICDSHSQILALVFW